jgi:hypothetical protein
MEKRIQKLLLMIAIPAMAFLGLSSLSQIALAESSILPPDVKVPTELDRNVNIATIVTTGLQWLMYAVGVVSIVMIIVGGIRYATSGGNAEKVKSAKNTILYACIGLGVALLALAIVNLVDTTTSGF